MQQNWHVCVDVLQEAVRKAQEELTKLKEVIMAQDKEIKVEEMCLFNWKNFSRHSRYFSFSNTCSHWFCRERTRRPIRWESRTTTSSWRSGRRNTTSISIIKTARMLLTRYTLCQDLVIFVLPWSFRKRFSIRSLRYSSLAGGSDAGRTRLDPVGAPFLWPAELLLWLQSQQPPWGGPAAEEAGGNHLQAGEERQQESHEHAERGRGEGEGLRSRLPNGFNLTLFVIAENGFCFCSTMTWWRKRESWRTTKQKSCRPLRSWTKRKMKL